MRLSRANTDQLWVVWHVPRCASLIDVVWIDDGLAQWAQYRTCVHGRYVVIGDAIAVDVYQAQRIVIYPDRHLVLIDPQDDLDLDLDELLDITVTDTREAA